MEIKGAWCLLGDFNAVLQDGERHGELSKKLWSEYEHVLIQEELLWFQKSRYKWLELGDRNTKYFHGSTLIRRRKN
uniref:Endonuclease/exonuclease/phosphatase domain-containing protein n=1 Tax=Cajanus cajan TaxID=3821 RepID=A0A151S1G5_CAJCA|nr:hypothetical protein KK1_029657 [Cajanus cajan]